MGKTFQIRMIAWQKSLPGFLGGIHSINRKNFHETWNGGNSLYNRLKEYLKGILM
jgi:hypothetical protein